MATKVQKRGNQHEVYLGFLCDNFKFQDLNNLILA